MAVGVGTFGCASARRSWVPIGTYTFLAGEFSAVVPASPADVLQAGAAALADAGVERVSSRSRSGVGELRGRRRDGVEISMGVRAEPASGPAATGSAAVERCRITIAIGAVGDEEESVRLFQAVIDRLGDGAGATTPPRG